MANRIATPLRGVILADPTFLSLQRQREVHESDVVEQHRQLLSLDKEAVLAQARTRHAHRSPELVELIAAARMKTRMSAFEVLTPPNPRLRFEQIREAGHGLHYDQPERFEAVVKSFLRSVATL